MIDLAESARFTTAHKRLWRPLAKGVATALLWVFGGLRVSGKTHVPREGGFLVLSNHLSDIDPVAVQCACPRMIHFMAKSELFEMRLLGRFLRGCGAFPVRRGEPDRAPLKVAASLLKNEESVGVFPEGELSESGRLQELKAGVALIVRLAPNVPVICCGIQNTQKVMPYRKFIPRPTFKKMVVNWGRPRVFTKDASAEEIIGWATAQLTELTVGS